MTLSSLNILPSPFPGLRPFQTEETHLFFGREGQIDEVLSKIDKHRFVAILGTSGSGKSSFMYCGMIPSLHGGFMANAGADWRVIVSRPGLSPIDNLSQAITQSELPEANDEEFRVRHNVNQAILRSSSVGLVEVINQLRGDGEENVLLLIDQFEELFRFNQEKDERHANETLAFVKLLTQAVEQRELPIYVVMTMRSDYIGDCAQFPNFTKMINDSHYLIPQMTREQKRNAILGPVAVGGGQMTSRLVQQLLNDLGDNPDQLPILQHALMRTWNFWSEHAQVTESIDLYHYEAIGGMAEALSMHANEAYEELDIEQQALCEQIFKCLTEKGADGRGIRRPTRLIDIIAITEASKEDVLEVVNRFRMPGRTLLMPSMETPVSDETVIDISHESLMRIWTKLREWVQEESDSVKMYLRLAEAADMYQRGTSSLWRPPDLQVAMAWEEKQRPNIHWGIRHDLAYERTMSFLSASKDAYEEEQKGKEKMQRKRMIFIRRIALMLGLAAIVSAFFLVYAQLQTQQAEENLARATEQEKLANERKEEADAEKLKAEKAAANAEEQRQKAMQQAEEAEKQKQRAESATARALDLQKEAEQSAREAKEAQAAAEKSAEEAALQKEQAEKNAQKATEQQERAQREESAAKRLRFKAIAQTMAVKSRQLEDTMQRALVASKAFDFNFVYNDGEVDPDIYTALHYARKALEGEDFNTFNQNTHTDGVEKLMTDAKGQRYSLGNDGLIKKWDTRAGTATDVFKSNYVCRDMDIASDQQLATVATNEGFVVLVDLKSGKEKQLFSAHEGGVLGTTFTNNAAGILSFGVDKAIKYHSVDGKKSYIIATPTSPVVEIIQGNSNTLIALLKNGQVWEWNIAEGSKGNMLLAEQKNETGTALTYSSQKDWLAIGFASGRVLLWDVKEKQQVQLLTGHKAQVSDIQFSRNSGYIASASFDGSVQLWNTARLNNPIAIFDDHEAWVWSCDFSADGKSVLTACANGDIKIYPISMDKNALTIKGELTRSLTEKEWEQFVGKDIPYEE